jgi:Undecaprenyl-phosphate galactose phosphotransferase WbaP
MRASVEESLRAVDVAQVSVQETILADLSAHPLATSACLLLVDILTLALSRWGGYRIWLQFNPQISQENHFQFWPSLLLYLLVYAFQGMYSAAGLSPVEELRRSVQGTAFVALVLAAVSFVSKDADSYSRGLLILSSLLAAFLLPWARSLVRDQLSAQPWWGVPVLILGAGKTARKIVENLRTHPEIGLKVVGCLADDHLDYADCGGAPVLGPLSMAAVIAQSTRVRHALVAMPGLERKALVGLTEKLSEHFRHLILIPNLFGLASLWVTGRDLGGVLGLEVRQNLLIPANWWIKRGMDLAMTLVVGICSIPVLAVAAAWIKIVSPGASPFYRQKREGEGRRDFSVWKLRTMYPNADKLLQEHLKANATAREEWESHLKLRNDPRILPVVGTLLRRTSLDELPQLLNIIKGEMTLVGPRPFPRYHLDRFDSRFQDLRAKVPPGLTGLWQVSARSDGDLKIQETLDTFYIRNWSLWLDLYILARTVRAVLLSKGAY